MKWTGVMLVTEAHRYTVEADTCEQARERIEAAFEEGETSDWFTTEECYVYDVQEKKEEQD